MILVIGGTSEEEEIVLSIVKKNISVVVSRATNFNTKTYNNKNVEIIFGRLDEEGMAKLIKERKIKCVIDGSHPYAEEVSRIAMKMPAKYIRYERISVEIPSHPLVKTFKNLETLVIELNKTKGNILWTAGVKNINILERIDKARIYIRCLPEKTSIEKCRSIGILEDNILKGIGPFTIIENEKIYKEKNIQALVTKESGRQGGFKEKVTPAIKIGIKVFILLRPKVSYPNIVYSTEEMIACINQLY